MFLKRKFLGACLLFALGGVAGFFLAEPLKGKIFSDSQELEVRCDQGVSPERESGYKFVNPLLDCGMEYIELSPFRAEISKLVEKEKERSGLLHISVYFRHLDNGYWFGINEKELFSPASLLKVPIMMAALKNMEIDSSVAGKKAVFKIPNSEFTRRITTYERLQPGVAYTVRELVERMVIDSDNDALPLLREMIDPDILVKVFTALGLQVPSESQEERMTVKAYAKFFRVLYNASYLTADSSEYALSLLSKTKFVDGIVAGVDPGTVVAHKFGERDTMGVRQLHDCGLVYYEQDPYLLCIMTRGRDFDAMTRAIREISHTVYRDVVKQVEVRRH